MVSKNVLISGCSPATIQSCPWLLPFLLGLLLLAFIGYRAGVHRLTMAGILPLLGRSGVCNFQQSVSSYTEWRSFNAEWRALAAHSKMVKEEQGLRLWQTPWGEFWAPKDTDLLYVLAEQVNEFYGRGERSVHPGDIVVDCGANVGTFTRNALRKGAKLVVAVEPVPPNVESLRRTFAREIGEGRVIVYAKGVWDKDDTLSMFVFKNSVLDSFVMRERTEESDKPREIKLPLTTIDKLVAELNLERVDFLKMDIEGAERNALAGARQTLQKYKPRMAIATENLQDDQYVVPRVISGIVPGYKSECGPCTLVGAEVRPDVFFFY